MVAFFVRFSRGLNVLRAVVQSCFVLEPRTEADADSVDSRRFTALPKRGVRDNAPTQQEHPGYEQHVRACEGAPGIMFGLLLTLLVAPRACVAWPVLGDPFADAANGRKLVSARTRAMNRSKTNAIFLFK